MNPSALCNTVLAWAILDVAPMEIEIGQRFGRTSPIGWPPFLLVAIFGPVRREPQVFLVTRQPIRDLLCPIPRHYAPV